MTAVVRTVAGTFAVDLEDGDVRPWEDAFPDVDEPVLNLPRLVAAAALGPTVVAVIATKPPLAVSHDGGQTWRSTGRGLPEGRAVAIDPDDPDHVVFAARNRLYRSQDGGVFWTALPVELPEILAVVF
jgi:photosystem II stability/assembly factor-like uncharacterized protein